MLKKILIPTILVILAYGFWVSPNFKEIAAGVAIFLFGMLFLEEGFKAFTGGILEKVLQRTTNTLPKSIGFGIVSTTIMQSSSLVSVITISFISAGLITLAAGIGIIFGANIGTSWGSRGRAWGTWDEHLVQRGLGPFYWIETERTSTWGTQSLFGHDYKYTGWDLFEEAGNKATQHDWSEVGGQVNLFALGVRASASPIEVADLAAGRLVSVLPNCRHREDR